MTDDGPARSRPGGGAVPPRVRWALQVVDPREDDRILEIGSGPGVAAALICDRLTTGRLLAVDRSPVAVQRTGRRNAAHVDAGRLVVRQGRLADLTLPPGGFDTAFAVDVNLFWVAEADRELAVLRSALRPGGLLAVLYGAEGPTASERIVPAVSARLRDSGFTDVTAVAGDGGIGVTGRRPGLGP